MGDRRTLAEVDEAIAGSFPASDPPSWTLGSREVEERRIGRQPMAIARAEATWTGTLQDGAGTLTGASGHLDAPYGYRSRFEGDRAGTSPEELLGAAHAGCFSMFLAAQLAAAGFPAARIHTAAAVHLASGPTIARIELTTEVDAPGVDDRTFQEKIDAAKRGCPVSQALAAVASISVHARLV